MQKNARAKNATIKMPAMIVLKVSSSIGYGSSAARECPAQGSKGARLAVAIA